MAPLVAGLMQAGLGILAGAVRSKGADLIEKKLGVNIGDMLGSEEGRVRLAEIEAAHEEELLRLELEDRKLDIREIELGIADVDSARKMQMAALTQSDSESKRFVYRFAWFWSLSAVVYAAFITFGTIPDSNIRFADTILGFLLGTIVAQLLQFFYGSSKGSKDKDFVNISSAITKGGKDV